MKTFSERSPILVGAVSVGILIVIVIGALQYKRLPFFSGTRDFTAEFVEASGISSGATVQVAGLQAGEVTDVSLDGSTVVVTFSVADDIYLGDRTEAAVKTKSLLGAKYLELIPRGEAPLSAPIPMDRTTPAYQLPDALGDLAETINGLNTDDLNRSMTTLAETFQNTAPDVRAAVDGVGRFTQSLNERDAELRNLLANANKATTVLAGRTDDIVALVRHTNDLLVHMRAQSNALDSLAANVTAIARQVSGLLEGNRTQLKSALDKLNGVLTIVDNRKERVQKAIKLLNAYAMSLGESVASGPFFKGYVANLLPGQFVQPFVDAAFSDLGLDPAVLAPSELTDPPTGQPGTPALPSPYPRTGQGGEPHLTLPDAITGKPGDPRYPYREPLPAPPPGGPPPGPPAPAPPGLASTPLPNPGPVSDPLSPPGTPPVLPAPQPQPIQGDQP
jgi:phospholipid/cholesterol/gamma-HCH transport system substrate-binding protein